MRLRDVSSIGHGRDCFKAVKPLNRRQAAALQNGGDMKKMTAGLVIGAALAGFLAGQAMRPGPEGVESGHFDELSMMPSAIAQEKGDVMPFGYNSPREPALAPDAPPITYWNWPWCRAHGQGPPPPTGSALLPSPISSHQKAFPYRAHACEHPSREGGPPSGPP